MPADAVIGVLLAGGRSRRFGGGDKCLAPLNGKPMLAHAIGRLAPQVDELILNANGDPGRFAEFSLPVVADPVEGFAGPLAGVLAGLDWARANANARWVATAATDSPLFPSDLVARLEGALGERYPAIALAACNGRTHPTFGLWPTALAEDLRQALLAGTRRVREWAERHDCALAAFDEQGAVGQRFDPFFNVNTKEELAAAEALLAGADQRAED